MKPSAKVVLDSISPDGVRATTMEFTFHRTELAELNTHRMFSRNAASSRAIPISKMLQRVKDDPAMPMRYGKNQKGMQSYENLDGESAKSCENAILAHMQDAVNLVEYLEMRGLHKQFANRYIEPWMTCVDIVTSVEWANFFHQRTHHAAHPNFNALALAVEEAYFNSTPQELYYGEWHTPYIRETDKDQLQYTTVESDWVKVANKYPKIDLIQNQITDVLKKVSAARCARVSYLNHDGTNPDIDADVDIFEKLRTSDPMHPSPLEHVLTPCYHMQTIKNHKQGAWTYEMYPPDGIQNYNDDLQLTCKRWGNTPGYHQFRKEFSRENVTEYVPQRLRESKE